MATITALQCPACGGPVRATSSSCPNCGVGLSVNYAELLGVGQYKVKGRDAILDAALLTLVNQEAEKQGVEVVPALSCDRVLVYVRHLKTGRLVCGGQIEALHDEYCIMGEAGHWYILPQTKLGQGGRIYLLGRHSRFSYHRSAEGEAQLGEIPEIRMWVANSVAVAKPEPAAIPAPPSRGFRLKFLLGG